MRVQPAHDSSNKQDAFSSRRSPLPIILIAANALLIGGCIALLIVSQLLRSQNEIYVLYQSWDASDAIMDFMEDLLPVYLLCGSLLMLTFLFSMTIWIWKGTQSRLLRFGSILLILLVLAALAYFWLLGATGSVAIR